MGVWLRFVRYDANVVLRTEGLPRHRRTRHPPAGRETLVCIRKTATWQATSLMAVFRFHLFIVLDAWNFLKNFNFQGTAFASADQSIAQRQQRHWARRALQPGGTSRLQHSVLQLSVSEGKQRSGGRKWGGHE